MNPKIDGNVEKKLLEEGLSLYDQMQKNLSWQVSRTDREILENPDPMAGLFGAAYNNPEEYRAFARRTRGKLDRQGREGFAMEYAQTQAKNLIE